MTLYTTWLAGVMRRAHLWDVRLPSDIQWNFAKFLINKHGVPVKVEQTRVPLNPVGHNCPTEVYC